MASMLVFLLIVIVILGGGLIMFHSELNNISEEKCKYEDRVNSLRNGLKPAEMLQNDSFEIIMRYPDDSFMWEYKSKNEQLILWNTINKYIIDILNDEWKKETAWNIRSTDDVVKEALDLNKKLREIENYTITWGLSYITKGLDRISPLYRASQNHTDFTVWADSLSYPSNDYFKYQEKYKEIIEPIKRCEGFRHYTIEDHKQDIAEAYERMSEKYGASYY